MRSNRIAWLCLLAALAAPPCAGQQAPADSGVEERVEVVLIEFKLLVTDKQGRPVTDLRPEEVRVLEGGREQRLAFVDSWLTAQSDPQTGTEGAAPATVYSATGEAAPRAAVPSVPAPRPVRRVIFIFDIKNSTIRIREEWRKAAIEWVDKQMQPDDLASVVLLRNYAQWILQATSDKDELRQALESVDLYTDSANRSRRSDMTELLNELNNACVNPGGAVRGSRDPVASQDLGDEATCAMGVIRPFIDQWGNESDESVMALRQLTGQLAAIPGRKAVMLFSEGIIPDPAEVAINAVLSVWGASAINFRVMGSSLRRNALEEIGNLHRVAAASDVVYFTLDTRSSSERGQGEELEMQLSQARGALGVNPWNEMYDATRSTLSGLAYATGGRPFYGKDEILEDLTLASESFYGVYNVGYYRSNPLDPGKLKVKIDRKGIEFELPKDAGFTKREAHKTAVELAVGRPVFSGLGDEQQLPVAVMTLFDKLPLRRGAGGRGCQLGIFLQAQRPDGSIAAERFDTATVVVEKSTLEELRGQYWEHRSGLELGPGQYRLRARLTDDYNSVVGDTFIDLTVGEGRIAPGFVELEPAPPAEAAPAPAG